MSLQNICAILWNFALFDTIFSVVDIPNLVECLKDLYQNQTAEVETAVGRKGLISVQRGVR